MKVIVIVLISCNYKKLHWPITFNNSIIYRYKYLQKIIIAPSLMALKYIKKDIFLFNVFEKYLILII